MMKYLIAAALVIAVLGPLCLHAQTFEVASVKPNKSTDERFTVGLDPGGRFTATNVQLRFLIAMAYGMPNPLLRVVGGPDWLNTDRFDIEAKPGRDLPNDPNGAPPPQIYPMLRTLLAERFKLAVHNETRDLPIYALVLAGNDGKLGARLHPSNVDCVAMRAANANAPLAPQPGGRPTCRIASAGGQMTGGAATMSQLVSAVAGRLDRPVVDKTGLSGGFDFDLTFEPIQLLQGAPSTGAQTLLPADPNGPSIFTALQEQLGLKLESTRGPIDVVVVDYAEQPTPD